MKRVILLGLVILMSASFVFAGGGNQGNSGRINLVAPRLGYNDDQIAAARAQNALEIGQHKYYVAVRRAIEQQYPEYNVEYVDWGWSEPLDQKQRSLFAAGDYPDLVTGEVFMPTYAGENILEPLPQDIVNMVNPSFLIYDRDNRPVSVAYCTGIFLLFYNKDLMARAGLDPEKPPKTWDEFRDMSARITAAGNGQFWGGGIPSFPHAGGAFRATPFFRQRGTDFYVNGQMNLNDPKLQDTLQFIRDMNANFPAGIANMADEQPLIDAFQKDKTIGFLIDGTWRAGEAAINGMNWGVAPLPLPTGGVTGNCLVGSVYLAVPKGAKNKEASFNLLRMALREDLERIWLLEERRCVPLNSLISNRSLLANDPTMLVAMEEMINGTYTGLVTFPQNDSQIWDIINQRVIARTTMTNDSISTICTDAMRDITPLTR